MSLYNKKIAAFALFYISMLFADAQTQMPEAGSNNLEVVYGVVLIILTGMFAYLFYIDRKVKKVEEKIKELD